MAAGVVGTLRGVFAVWLALQTGYSTPFARQTVAARLPLSEALWGWTAAARPQSAAFPKSAECSSASRADKAARSLATAQERPPDVSVLAVAPMVGCTDRHFRRLARLLSNDIFLYTEMQPVVDGALDGEAPTGVSSALAGEAAFLDEKTALQIAAGDVHAASLAGRAVGEALRRLERKTLSILTFNLNCGCPSPSAGAGSFGLALMRRPKAVASIVQTIVTAAKTQISANVRIGCSVKCRLAVVERGPSVDECQSKGQLFRFLSTCDDAAVCEASNAAPETADPRHFIIHARDGVLGFSCSSNAVPPPLDYDRAASEASAAAEEVVRRTPGRRLYFTLNGGVDTPEAAAELLERSGGVFSGVMVGRSLWKDPWLWLRCADSFIRSRAEPPFSTANKSSLEALTRHDALLRYAEYAEAELQRAAEKGEKPRSSALCSALLKPLFNLFAGVRGSSRFKQQLAEHQSASQSFSETIFRALGHIPREALHEPRQV